MAKLWRSVAMASFALSLVTGFPASAQFVEYFAVTGEWSVTCARDLLSTQATCGLSAPRLRLGQPSTAVLTIATPSGTSPTVSFRIPGIVNATTSVSASVDDAAAHESQMNRYGESHWTGAVGAGLIQSMQAGKNLNLSWWPEGESAPRAVIISLFGFSQAFDDYQKRVTVKKARP